MQFLGKKIRWRVLPIALLIFSSLWFGFEQGQKAAGLLALQQCDYAKALELFSQIGYESGIGGVYLALNQPDEAIKHYQVANDASGLGLSFCKKRDFKTALSYFQTAKDNSGCGLAYLGLRDEANAKACFTQANDWSGLGLLHLAKKNYVEAERCFNQVQDFSGLGLTSLKQKKYADAVRCFQQAQDTSGLGLVALATQNHKKAAEYFLSNRDLAGLGYAFMNMGNPRKAYQCFIAANDLDGLGDLYSRQRAFGKAREMFEKDNNPLKVIQSYRNDYTLSEKFQRAIAYGQKAVAAGRLVPECLMEMADVYYELGQVDQAIAALDQAASHPGYESEAHLFKGRIYFYQRQLEQAKAEFQQVKPDDFSGETRYAEAQASLKDIAVYQGLNIRAAPSF